MNGWPDPIPPYITYPVQNLAWGKNNEPPPYEAASFIPTNQTMLGPGQQVRVSAAPAARPSPPKTVPAPRAVTVQPTAPTGMAPIPVQDYFRILRNA